MKINGPNMGLIRKALPCDVGTPLKINEILPTYLFLAGTFPVTHLFRWPARKLLKTPKSVSYKRMEMLNFSFILPHLPSRGSTLLKTQVSK